MIRSINRLTLCAAAAMAAASLTACGSGDAPTTQAEATVSSGGEASAAPAAANIDPVMANPQVGDLYSGELTAFSQAEFEGGAKTYGMMRVVAVDPAKVTVITENAGYPAQSPATDELNSGSLANVTWDENERIDIQRSDIPRLLNEGKIAAFRRP
jgi:hypothetical protein